MRTLAIDHEVVVLNQRAAVVKTETSAPGQGANKGTGPAEDISVRDRLTEELAIGFVGPVGSGVSKAREILSDILTKIFGYSVNIVKVSNVIIETACTLGEEVPDKDAPTSVRTRALQELGNDFRRKFGRDYLAKKVVERIAGDRLSPPDGAQQGYKPSNDEKEEVSPIVTLRRRRAHLIDSLKHPDEIRLLQEVYGDTFWLIGVFAPEQVRLERLKNLGHAGETLGAIMAHDEDEDLDYGQKVRDSIYQSDFFIRNDRQNETGLRKALQRYLSLVFNTKVNTPMEDEAAMFSAGSQAAMSACLSRQVGAAIVNANGELIGVGANDVPKYGGGLYCSADGDHDYRCHNYLGCVCHNDQRKDKLYESIFNEMFMGKLLGSSKNKESVKSVLRKTEIKNITEYSRAVHAEMEAILSVARGAKHGLVGSTMYVTTFPCHACARHIVASGITKVIYIEPYAKSLAQDLHGDSISTSDTGGKCKVVFLQYEGVAPKNMLRLFRHGADRKRDGALFLQDPQTAVPVFPAPLDGFGTREQIVVHELERLEGSSDSKEGDGDHGAKDSPAAAQLSLVGPRQSD